ncbi:MAG: hypothetical protein GY940_21385, partial [bacterium]|nr:hypothetical protein [bacterium]
QESSYKAIVRKIFNIEFPFSRETELKWEEFREMMGAIRGKKPVDMKKFETLVLEIADRGVELDGIMRREIQSLERRIGKELNIWRK